MTPGTAERLNAALTGRYLVERELGEGGMATVYLAQDLKHNRPVALKVLKPELAAVVGAERFLAEIETTANLQHPHVLPLFDSGEADRFLFYVMPYVEGDTLADRLGREKQLPVEEAVRMATAVANALHHAHERGVIHRDVKPANILLQDGEPVVADFGIALAVGAAGGSRLTETGLSVGTPFYMSPEQATGDQQVGPASDTYALAAVLYEMLVGDPPYVGSTAQAVLGKILQGDPVSATEARKTIPPHVDAAIRKALERLPADRFANAHDFARALGDPTFRHGHVAAGDPAELLAWRRRAQVAGGVATVFALATLWAMLRTPPPAPAPVERFSSLFEAGQESVDATWRTYALSPDGSALVYTGASDDAPFQLWLRRWDALDATPIRGTDGALWPTISGDGREFAFVHEGQIKAMALAGGPVRTLIPQVMILPHWGADGYVYAAGAGGPADSVGVTRVPAGGGALEVLTSKAEGEQVHEVSQVLPGGEIALMWVQVSLEDFEVRTLDLRTRDMRLVASGYSARYVPTGHLLWLSADDVLMAAPFDAGRGELSGRPVPLLEGVDWYSVSETGTLVRSSGSGGNAGDLEFVWVTRTGEATPVSEGWSFPPGDPNRGWRLSPEGTRLAYRRQGEVDSDIWVKELDDGPDSRLTFDGSHERKPGWSPDGSMVTFLSDRGGDLDAWWKRADGIGDAELLYDHEAGLAQGFLSRDGAWLVLRRAGVANQTGQRDILALRVGVDSVAQPLLTAPYDEVAPELSPDGRWLAYASNETGNYEVFVRPFPDVDANRVQVSVGGGTGPLWSRDGSELFYHDTESRLVSVRFETEPRFRVIDRTPLFTVPVGYQGRGGGAGFTTGMYDVAPDGRFLMARPYNRGGAGDQPVRVVLVRNWFEELRARMGG